MSDKHHTEQIYDAEMAPLVAKLIEISKREKIPLLVSAGLLLDGEDPGGCCTLLVYGNKEGQDRRLLGQENRLNLALGVIRGHNGFDRAAGLMISRFHPDAPTPPAAPGEE